MFQYEFARRLVSSSGNKNYGRISVMFSAKMEGDMKLKVPKGLFYPVPKVDAAVVGFGPKKQYLKKPVDVDVFNKLVHVVFLNRRKKLKNTVTPPSMGVDLEKEDILWILEDIGVRDLRPEELSPEVFIDLSDRISGLK